MRNLIGTIFYLLKNILSSDRNDYISTESADFLGASIMVSKGNVASDIISGAFMPVGLGIKLKL